jgi:hypothetical protein
MCIIRFAEQLDIVADPEVAQMNLLSMPGITDERVTKHIIDTAQSVQTHWNY